VALGGLLFAAGRGERLRPQTDAVPKPALDVGGTPLGAWGLLALKGAGLQVAANVSHLGEVVEAALRPYDPDLIILDEGAEPYGTAGTLRAFRRLFGPRIVTYNADLLSDLVPTELIAAHRRTRLPMTVGVQEVAEGADLVVENDRAIAFVDRRSEPDVQGVRFAGAAVIEQRALDLIPPEGPRGIGEWLMAPLVERAELGVMIHRGYALDVGTPERLEKARRDIRDGILAVPVRRT
jgi:MurNAc alpha-1-phosphate uridylyltransferase